MNRFDRVETIDRRKRGIVTDLPELNLTTLENSPHAVLLWEIQVEFLGQFLDLIVDSLRLTSSVMAGPCTRLGLGRARKNDVETNPKKENAQQLSSGQRWSHRFIIRDARRLWRARDTLLCFTERSMIRSITTIPMPPGGRADDHNSRIACVA